MKWKMATALVLCGFIGMAAAKSWDMDRTVDQNFVAASAFARGGTSASARTATLYLDTIGGADTTEAIEIGPWRQVVMLYTATYGADSTDDSVDCQVNIDISWDGSNWTAFDSVTLTDTVFVKAQVDSTKAIEGSYLRLRYAAKTGARVDTIAERPSITARVIAK